MNLTPELLLEAKFSMVRRGYEIGEVDDFLERCAEWLDVLLNRLRNEFERAEAAEAKVAQLEEKLSAGAPAPAPPPPAPVVEAAPEPAPAPEPAAVPEPDATEALRILVSAEKTAAATVAEAEEEAARLRDEAAQALEDARANAEAEARRAGEEARRSVEAEVMDLRRDRDALTTDVRSLSRWLDDQRGRIRAAARDLQRIVDDPAALREAPLPETLDEAGAPPVAEASTDEPAGEATVDDAPSDGDPTQANPVIGGDDGPLAP